MIKLLVLASSGGVGSYYRQGLVEPLSPWIAEAGVDLDDFFSAPLAQCESSDGETVCLPWGSDLYALFWNKELFAQAGLDPERPPQTMEELAEYANVLTVRDEQGELVQVGFIPDLSRSHTELYARFFGGAGRSGVESAARAFDAQPVIDALNWQRG